MEFRRRLMRLAIDSVVGRTIPNLKIDRNRGIRSLVDLGTHFASSEQQKNIFTKLQKIAHSPKNPYNALLLRAVNESDAEIIRRVGVNLGYTAFTCGTGIIRQNSKKWGTPFPWILLLDCLDCSAEQLAGMLREGETYGIFNYIVLIRCKKDFNMLTTLTSQFSESTFWAVMSSDFADEQICHTIKERKNVVAIVEVNAPEDASKLHILKTNALLFGFLCRDTQPFLERSFLTSMAESGCLFGVYSGKDLLNAVGLHKQRFFFPHNHQKYPLAIVDWQRDVQLIGGQILPGSGCKIIRYETAVRHQFQLGPILWGKKG